jgi:hypothetical protein
MINLTTINKDENLIFDTLWTGSGILLPGLKKRFRNREMQQQPQTWRIPAMR